MFSNNFPGYDDHLLFEQLFPESYNQKYDTTLLPEIVENYFSVQIRCLRFLDSNRFLSSSVQKLIASLQDFKLGDSEGLKDDLFTVKLAYPYGKFNLEIKNELLLLVKEDNKSTLTQSVITRQ